jgi:hypothetical protein
VQSFSCSACQHLPAYNVFLVPVWRDIAASISFLVFQAHKPVGTLQHASYLYLHLLAAFAFFQITSSSCHAS